MTRNIKWQRAITLVMALILSFATIAWLTRLNDRMTIRYQAIGRVVDASRNPVVGMQAILLLEPPPPDGPQLDALFKRAVGDQATPGPSYSGRIGPVVGRTDASGAVLVRATGRLGPAHLIRLGLDRSGRPPFETAWLVLRKKGMPDTTRTLSILSWRPSPRDWGSFANRLPLITLHHD